MGITWWVGLKFPSIVGYSVALTVIRPWSDWTKEKLSTAMNITKTYSRAYEHLKTKGPVLIGNYTNAYEHQLFVCTKGILKTENTVTCKYLNRKLNIENKLTTVGFVLMTAFEPYIGNSEIMDMKSVIHQIRNSCHASATIAQHTQFFIQTLFYFTNANYIYGSTKCQS